MVKKITNLRKKINIKMIRNIILFLGLIALTYWLIFKDQDMGELYKLIKSTNKIYLILGALVMFMYYVMEAFNIKCLLKVFGDKASLFSSLKYTFIGFFFSAITPAATGGQPIEIYYMNKDNHSGPNSTLIMLIQLCGFQISTILLGIICAIINHNIFTGGLFWLFLLGLTINGLALFIMLVCIFSKETSKKIINIFLKLMKKLKVKKLEEKKKDIYNGLEKYNESAIFIKNNRLEFIKAISRVFIQIVFYYSVPFFVYKSFGLSGYNYIQIFMMQAVLYTTVSSLPLPGAIGISETIFLKIFKPVFGKKLISGSMLLSRGITFYLYVIVSLIVVIITAIKTKDIISEIDKKAVKYDVATSNNKSQ